MSEHTLLDALGRRNRKHEGEGLQEPKGGGCVNELEKQEYDRLKAAHDELVAMLERVQRAIEPLDFWPSLKRDLAELIARARGAES